MSVAGSKKARMQGCADEWIGGEDAPQDSWSKNVVVSTAKNVHY